MAVTKLGAKLMSLEKRASFGIGSVIMPGFMAMSAAKQVASGENSLGGSLGDLGGGLAGWSIGSKAIGALTKSMKPGFLQKALGFGGGMIGSDLGGSVGSSIGDKILSWRRKPPTYDSWINANGERSQPKA